MVAVIDVDSYLFCAFSELTCLLEDIKMGAFWLHSESKTTGVVLVSCRAWKCFPTAISRGVDISEVSGCHLSRQMSSQ